MSTAQVLDRKAEPDMASPTAVRNVSGDDFKRSAPQSGLNRLGARLAGVGVATVLVVAAALIIPSLGFGTQRDPGLEPAQPQPRISLTTALGPATVGTNGPVELSLQSITYGPGESSGWHLHPGVHLVAILSGTLTVYGADCQPQTFGTGQPYIGGETLHVARNESDAPLEMAVTYVTRPGESMQHFRVAGAAPAGCPIS